MIDTHYFAGGLTDTPEVRFTPSGAGVVSFTLAQSDSKKNEAGEWETTRSVYLPVTLWDTDRVRWTEALTNLTKGTKLVVRGKLITRQWEDKEGNRRSRAEIHAFHAWVDAAAAHKTPQQQQPTTTWGAPQTGGFAGGDEQPPF